ncbi:MAG: copper amine oxidase N-terminal domain-containing protein [Syntrophomonadaceae bacterium]
MFKKRWLALLLVLLMAISLVSGCSPAEKGYYGLMSEVRTLQVFEDSGNCTVDLSALPAGMFMGQDALSTPTLNNTLGQMRIEYKGRIDIKQQVFQYDYTIWDCRTGAQEGAFSMAYKDGVMYIKVDELMGLVKELCTPAEGENLDRIFAGVAWVSWSDRDLTGLVPGGQAGVISQMLYNSSGQQLLFKKLFDGLVNDVYNDYSSSLVTQSGSRYTMTLRGSDLMDVFKSGAIYTIKNIDKLSQSLKNFLNGLTPAEAAQLGLTYDARLQALQGLDEMVRETKQDGQKAIQEIDGMSAASEAELLRVINDSEMVSSIEKTGNNTYRVTSRVHLNISDPAKPWDRLVCTFAAERAITAGGTVQVTAPAGAVSLTELRDRMPRKMTVNIDSGYYSNSNGLFSNSGRLSVQMVDGRTYLPLRMVGESLGETVGWDQVAHQAYVMQNGQRINMTGIIADNRTYIKMLDFERLGYSVGWNGYIRTVTIAK